MTRPRTILITGTGLIGGFLARELSRAGQSVTAISRSGIVRSGEESIHSARIVCHDLSRPIPDIGRFDFILHTAALSPAKTMPSPQEFFRSNVIGTLSVAHYARRTRPKLVIYCSAVSVYGSVQESVVTEDTEIRCTDWYGMTKYAGETILQQNADACNTLVLRLPAVLGPSSYRPWLGWVLRKGMAGEVVPIYNPNSRFNNVTDLSEVLRFVTQLLETPTKSFDIVQMAARESIAVKQAAQRVLRRIRSDWRLVEEESHRNSFSLSIEKLRNSYHFEPDATTAIIDRYVQEMMPCRPTEMVR